MPIAVETVLTDSTDIRFESNMTEKQHKRYNQILNARVEESAAKNYRGAPIKYSHRYEQDDFFSTDGGGPGPRGKKVRVTRDQRTGVIPENGIIIKERVADMNILSPKRAFDFRISINIERPSTSPASFQLSVLSVALTGRLAHSSATERVAFASTVQRPHLVQPSALQHRFDPGQG